MQPHDAAPRSQLPTGDSLTKQFVNECRLGRDYVFTIVSHFTRQTRSILSLSVSLTRDEFCSLTELKRDGRIPTATDERERADFERASGARVGVSERRVASQSPVRSDRRDRERASMGRGRAGGRDNNAKYGRKEE